MRDNELLLIVGTGPTMWDDVERFWEFYVPHDVCCINLAGLVYPCNFKHWFSYHSCSLVMEWSPQRPGAELGTAGRPMDGIQKYRLPTTGGSSSLQAVRVALRYWGYTRVVVAGVPLTDRYFEVFFPHWKDARREIQDFTRSMSGATRDLLGEPDEKWLSGELT